MVYQPAGATTGDRLLLIQFQRTDSRHLEELTEFSFQIAPEERANAELSYTSIAPTLLCRAGTLPEHGRRAIAFTAIAGEWIAKLKPAAAAL